MGEGWPVQLRREEGASQVPSPHCWSWHTKMLSPGCKDHIPHCAVFRPQLGCYPQSTGSSKSRGYYHPKRKRLPEDLRWALQAHPAMNSRCWVSGCFLCTRHPDQKARSLQVVGLVSLLPRVVCKQVDRAGAVSCLPPTLCGDSWK